MTKITKKFNIALLAGLIAASGSFIAPQALAADRGGRGGHPEGGHSGGHHQEGEQGDRLARAFDRLDTDGNGVLTLEEMTANVDSKAERLLAVKDSDEDGLLSLAEFTTNRRGEVRDLSAIADDIVQCVTDLKAQSGDDNIEVPDAADFLSPEQRFAALDTSADGCVDLAELQAAGLAKATEKFAAMDSDDNGEVSSDEFAASVAVHRATGAAIRQCVHEINDESLN